MGVSARVHNQQRVCVNAIAAGHADFSIVRLCRGTPARPAHLHQLGSQPWLSPGRRCGAGQAAARAQAALATVSSVVAAATTNREIGLERLGASLLVGEHLEAAAQLEGLLGRDVLPSCTACSQTIKGAVKRQGSNAGRGGHLHIGLCGSAPWPRLWALHRDLIKRGVVLSRPVNLLVLKTAIQGCHLSNAMALFAEMVTADGRPDQRLYVTAMSQLLRLRKRGLANAAQAYRLWCDLRDSGMQLDACSYRAGMNACVSIGRVQEATSLLQCMRAAGVAPGNGAFNILMKFYAQRGDMGTVRRLFRTMREYRYHPNAITYNTLLSGFVSGGQLVMARAVMDKMRREGVKPDVWTFSSFIQGLARSQRFEEAEAVLTEMRAADVLPNQHTYGALIDGHLRRNDVASATRIFSLMRAERLRPNAVIYNMLIKGYARAGVDGLPAAQRLLDQMQAQGLVPGVDTHCTVLQAAAAAGDESAAEGMLERMKAAGQPHDAVVATTMMKLYAAQSRFDDALRVFQTLEDTAASPLAGGGDGAVDQVALNALVGVLSAAGRMPEAERALERAASFAAAHGRRAPVEAFGALIKGYCRGGAVRPALDTFRRFLSVGGRPHPRMANAIVIVCLKAGELKAAMQAIRAMELLGIDVNRERYRQWFEQYKLSSQHHSSGAGDVRRGGSSSEGTEGTRTYSTEAAVKPGGGSAGGEGGVGDTTVERFKWWLGLPNRYYESDWRK